jgi:chaperonin cofactor prefoldin
MHVVPGRCMSPDSPETRIARLEQKVAKLEQRVEDLLVSIKAQFDGLDEDLRQFAPMLKEVNDLRHELNLAITEAKGARQDLTDLRDTLDARAEIQRLERKTDRKWLIGTILASAMLVIAAVQVLGGLG